MAASRFTLPDNIQSKPMQSQSRYTLPDEESTGWSGVGEDIIQKAKGIPHALMQFREHLPENALGAAKQVGMFPYEAAKGAYDYATTGHGELPRATKNVYSGMQGLVNTPSKIADYLARKGIVDENAGDSIRPPESIGQHDFNLGEQQPGDTLLQGLPGTVIAGAAGKLLPELNALRPSIRRETKLNNAVEELNKINTSHSQFLGEGQAHTNRAAEQFKNAIEGEEGLRRKVGSQYDQLANDMAHENVTIPTTPNMKAIQKEVAKLGKNVTESERENLTKILSSAESSKQVNGADALTTYRELKRQKNKAFKNAYSHGTSPLTHDEWMQKGNDLAGLEQRMRNLISEQVGAHHLEKLKSIDTEYATKIAPLYENPMYQQMLRHGQTSKNMMKELHGTTPGNETLNEIVKQIPELQKLIVGQQYAASPKKLLEANEMLNKYIKLNPHIVKMIEEQKIAEHLQKNRIPELEKEIMKARERKLGRRGIVKGAIGTVGAIGAGIGVETMLGRDWKKDLPWLLALKRANSHKK